MNTQLDSSKRAATAELIETLLDDAEFFSDVEDFALENHGFTAENIPVMIEEVLSCLPYEYKAEEVDWQAAARSLNEEFGYVEHSKKFYLCLQAFAVDELGRERPSLALTTTEFKPGDDVEVFLADVRRQIGIFIKSVEGKVG